MKLHPFAYLCSITCQEANLDTHPCEDLKFMIHQSTVWNINVAVVEFMAERQHIPWMDYSSLPDGLVSVQIY